MTPIPPMVILARRIKSGERAVVRFRVEVSGEGFILPGVGDRRERMSVAWSGLGQ